MYVEIGFIDFPWSPYFQNSCFCTFAQQDSFICNYKKPKFDKSLVTKNSTPYKFYLISQKIKKSLLMYLNIQMIAIFSKLKVNLKTTLLLYRPSVEFLLIWTLTFTLNIRQVNTQRHPPFSVCMMTLILFLVASNSRTWSSLYRLISPWNVTSKWLSLIPWKTTPYLKQCINYHYSWFLHSQLFTKL